MKYYLEAPFPFIIGCDSKLINLQYAQDLGINVVFLDERKIYYVDLLPKLPEKPLKHLLNRLNRVAGHFKEADPML